MRLTEDILPYICSALDDMKESAVRPTDGDRIIQKTLLNIQIVCDAGWHAATPYIWKTLYLTRAEDYASIFHPIIRLLESAPRISQNRRYTHVFSLINANSSRRAGVNRFMVATSWVREIVIDTVPSAQLAEPVDLAAILAEHLYHKARYLENADTLHLRVIGQTLGCEPTWNQELETLREFNAQFVPVRVEVWDTSWCNFDRHPKFWPHFQFLSRSWLKLMFTFHDAGPQELVYIARLSADTRIGSAQVRLASIDAWAEYVVGYEMNGHDPETKVSFELGFWIGEAILKRDHDFINTELEIWSWPECPCGCSPEKHVSIDKGRVISLVVQYAVFYLKLQCPASDWSVHERNIRNAFQAKRVHLCEPPCSAVLYAEDER